MDSMGTSAADKRPVSQRLEGVCVLCLILGSLNLYLECHFFLAFLILHSQPYFWSLPDTPQTQSHLRHMLRIEFEAG